MVGVSGEPPDGGDRLLLPAGLARAMAAELEEAYPAEGCGVLLGRVEGGDRRVTELAGAENRWPDRDDRYLVDPGTLRRLMEREDHGGPRVLGFYHSHPDAEPVPSGTDRELAWPWYLYLIVPVEAREAGEGRAWTLEDGGDDFVERPVARPDGEGRET